jgi:predicted dehydrogenase
VAAGGDAVHVRYRFASGVIVEASCRRSATPGTGTSETVVGSRGRADLLAATIERANEGLWRAEACRPGEAGAMYQAGVDALLRTIRSGGPDRGESGVGTAVSGRRLLRATALAVMGRMASNGDQIAWGDVCSPAATA